jgi:hypothetical protein
MRPRLFFPFGEGVGFLGFLLFTSSFHDYPIKFPMGSQLFPKFPMFLNVFPFASHLSHMLCTKSSSFRWATMGIDMFLCLKWILQNWAILRKIPHSLIKVGIRALPFLHLVISACLGSW